MAHALALDDCTGTPGRGCPRCERLPAPLPAHGALWLAFPVIHVRRKAERVFERMGIRVTAHPEDVVAAAVEPARADEVAAALAGELSDVERRDTRALFLAPGITPAPSDLARVTSLGQLLADREAHWLRALLDEGRLTAHFQPVVSTADGTVIGHEALARGTDPSGALIPPGRLFGAARDAGLLFQLDLATRRRAVQRAHDLGLDGLVLVNFTPSSIYDPETCLRSTVAAVDAAGFAHDRIVFEIVETEQLNDTGQLRRILSFYRDAGFRVALDDIGSGYSSLNVLHQLRPDFLKLDMELVRNVHMDPFKATIAAKLLEIAQALDITAIAEGIESAEELAWVATHGATYAQGYFLGRPAADPRTGVMR